MIILQTNMFGRNGQKVKKDTFEDDGRTIAPMNLEGMPGYRPWLKDRASGQAADNSNNENNIAKTGGGRPMYGAEELAKEQIRAYRFAALKAGLLVALVFAVVFFLFLAFCDFVWFR